MPYIAPLSESTSVFKKDIFNGKVLFCTGGGSGICKQITETIMRHGANATIIGRNVERLEKASEELSKATGKVCIPAQADVRKPEQLKAAVEKTIAKFGRIDFVVCGAAGNFIAPISGLSENAFKTVIEIDTLGTFNTLKATIPHVRKTKGAYLHISATLHYKGMPLQAHVSAAKAGVDALSAVIAVEEGPWGVRSNVLAPGAVSGTEGMNRLGPVRRDGSRDTDIYLPKTPLGRECDVRDIANTAVFLFSGAASMITGTVIVQDGGGQHLQSTAFPYPESVLDFQSVSGMVRGKL